MKRPSKKILSVVMLSGAAAQSFAGGLQLASQDAFAAARGNAFTATADNASAIYYNPAGLTQIEGTELQGSLYALYLDPTFTPPATASNAGHTYAVAKHYAFIPQDFLAHTFTNLPVSIGLGVYAPFGGSISWPQDTGFRSVAIRGSTTYIRVNPSIAVKLGEHLSLGAGISGNWARMNLEQGLRAQEKPFANDFRFTGNGWAVGYNVGALWKPFPFLTIGATARSNTRFRLDGETSFIREPVIARTTIPASVNVEFPWTGSVGVSLRPTEKWNIEFDADYADWKSFGDLEIRQQQLPPFPVQQNIPVKLRWQESWTYELGVTRYFDHGWQASAGYMYSENSVPNDYYTPLAADLNRHFLSVGVGHRGRHIDFDVTYQFGYGPAHTVSGSQPASTPAVFAGQNADGTYKFISHAILLTAGLRF